MIELIRFDSLESTNDEAKRLAAEGAPEGTTVWALSQTKGRGRHGAGWLSPEGNAFLSVIIRPELPVDLAGRLAVAAGQAVASTLSRHTGVAIRTKWPNDIVLNGRKLGGILVETGSAASRVQWAVVGVGVNVAHAPTVEPPGVPAACLAETGRQIPLDEVVEMTASAVAGIGPACATEEGWRGVQARWADMDDAHGPVVVLAPDGEWEGFGAALDADGALLVESPAGTQRVTTDVSIRRRPA